MAGCSGNPFFTSELQKQQRCLHDDPSGPLLFPLAILGSLAGPCSLCTGSEEAVCKALWGLRAASLPTGMLSKAADDKETNGWPRPCAGMWFQLTCSGLSDPVCCIMYMFPLINPQSFVNKTVVQMSSLVKSLACLSLSL